LLIFGFDYEVQIPRGALRRQVLAAADSILAGAPSIHPRNQADASWELPFVDDLRAVRGRER